MANILHPAFCILHFSVFLAGTAGTQSRRPGFVAVIKNWNSVRQGQTPPPTSSSFPPASPVLSASSARVLLCSAQRVLPGDPYPGGAGNGNRTRISAVGGRRRNLWTIPAFPVGNGLGAVPGRRKAAPCYASEPSAASTSAAAARRMFSIRRCRSCSLSSGRWIRTMFCVCTLFCVCSISTHPFRTSYARSS